MIDVSVVVGSNGTLPTQESEESAGFDLYSAVNTEIFPGERKLISTGLTMAIPKGYELQIRPRSGLAYKQGLTVINSPGTIDSDYRGTIGVVLINHGDRMFRINLNDRIAQGVFNKLPEVKLNVVDNLDETKRGAGGFGSTGK